jgi:hypothetical protein
MSLGEPLSKVRLACAIALVVCAAAFAGVPLAGTAPPTQRRPRDLDRLEAVVQYVIVSHWMSQDTTAPLRIKRGLLKGPLPLPLAYVEVDELPYMSARESFLFDDTINAVREEYEVVFYTEPPHLVTYYYEVARVPDGWRLVRVRGGLVI